MRTALYLLLCSVLCALLPWEAAAKDPAYAERVKAFSKALKSRDPKARARAFDYLRGETNPKVIDDFIDGVKKVKASNEKVRRDQKKTEEAYTDAINALRRAQEALEMSAGSSRDMKRYNDKERKISKAREGAVMKLKNLENDFSRNRGLLQQAEIALAECLEAMDDQQLATALGVLQPAWLFSKETDDRLRFLGAVSELKKPVITDLLHAVVDSEEQPTIIRIAAIDALAAREDGALFGKVMKMLELPTEQQPFLITAIGVLRRMHDKRGISPLITFLERDDIKRTREDAYKALMSLTGQNHGRYAGEWKKWWDEAKNEFVMPKDPMPPGDLAQPDKGGTFYGIPITSDRILYVVDISGSMDKVQKDGTSNGKTKWQVLQEELIGSVMTLNPTDTFNVIFFNHEVILWQSRKVEASERNKKLLKKWVEEQKPLGGTNISDSLYKGFSIASSVTGRPALDTVFFLTDGKPTAGRIWDPERILDTFREWNQTAKLTVHTIGIGDDHDAAFLQELAKIGDGKYVKR